MNLLFATITYGPTEPMHNRTIRTAIMHAAKHGHTWVGDISPDKQFWVEARNTVIEAVDSFPTADAVFWVDSDIVLPTDAITRLAAEKHDFISGLYFTRVGEPIPLAALWNEQKRGYNFLKEWPENCVVPVDGVGFGCLLTSTRLIKSLAKPCFRWTKFSEDFSFCEKAKKAGWQLYLDTGVLCGHLGDPRIVTYEDWKKQCIKYGDEREFRGIKSGDLLPPGRE